MFDWSYTLITVMVGTAILGAVAGALGTFLTLRRQALIGDALSHAALPGIALAYIITQIRSLSMLLLGAALSAFFAMFLLNVIKRFTRIKFDASMALLLSGFFGFGQVLLSQIQKTGAASQAGLSRFILGQAATMLRADVMMIALIAFGVGVVIILFFKMLKLYIFDAAFYRSLGLSERFASALLSVLTVIIVVIGIRLVGVILMSALIIAPSVAARQLSNRFSGNVLIAMMIGAFSGFIGTLISASRANLPSGPVITVVLGMIVITLLVFSPTRGLMRQTVERVRFRKRIIKYRALIHLYENNALACDEDVCERYEKHDLLVKTEEGYALTDKGRHIVKTLMGADAS